MRKYFFTISGDDTNSTRVMISAASIERAFEELNANFTGARIMSLFMGAYVPGRSEILRAN